MSSKKKKQQIRPDRLSSSKQKDSVQKAIQKNAKTLERRLQKIGETTKPQQMKQIRFPVPKSLALHNRYRNHGTKYPIGKKRENITDK